MVRTAKIGNANFLAAEIRRVVNFLARDEAVFIFIVNSCVIGKSAPEAIARPGAPVTLAEVVISPDPRLEQCRAARDGQ